MKALVNFDNIAKARLLHELFPNEIPALLDNIKEVCADLKTNEYVYRGLWDFGLMTFDAWLLLAENAEKIIIKQRSQLIKSSKVFSEQLFHSFDYTVLFVNDRIVKYALEMDEQSKFRRAVDLLFNP